MRWGIEEMGGEERRGGRREEGLEGRGRAGG